MDALILFFILEPPPAQFSTVLAVGLSKWLLLCLSMIFLYLFGQDFYQEGIWILSNVVLCISGEDEMGVNPSSC